MKTRKRWTIAEIVALKNYNQAATDQTCLDDRVEQKLVPVFTRLGSMLTEINNRLDVVEDFQCAFSEKVTEIFEEAIKVAKDKR